MAGTISESFNFTEDFEVGIEGGDSAMSTLGTDVIVCIVVEDVGRVYFGEDGLQLLIGVVENCRSDDSC